MAPPRLRDVDLTDRDTGHRLTATFTTDGPLPATGTVVYSIFAGSAGDGLGYQLGVKVLDGQPIAHFVFDHVHAQQSDLDVDVTVQGTTLTATFPAEEAPRLGASFDWSATFDHRRRGRGQPPAPDLRPVLTTGGASRAAT